MHTNLVFCFLFYTFTLVVTSDVQETESGLIIEYVSKPEKCEKFAKKGDKLTMHYTGRLDSFEDGVDNIFDSSLKREPLEFQIGVGKVVKGWDEGILGMCIGEKRKLTVPPHLGYGKRGKPEAFRPIPGSATLYFEVKLLGITDGPQKKNVFKAIDENNDREITKEELKNYLVKQVRFVRLNLIRYNRNYFF